MDPDRLLVTDASAGSREAFDELVHRYRRRVYNFVRALTGGPGADAEDLVQEIFLRAYCAIGAFRGDSAFRSWLYRIAVNVVLTDRSRRRVQRIDRAVCLDEAIDVDRRSVPHDVEDRLARREAIDRALATLPDDLRMLIVLRDLHSLEYEDIARIVRIPRGTFDSRLFRARRRLRPLLRELLPPARRDDE